jgi:SAM-dependent methyltransferase
MDRAGKLLGLVDLVLHEGIELVSHDRPLARRLSDPHSPNPRLITISYVHDERSIAEAIGPHRRFDFVLASHVIQYVPDLIAFLNDVTGVLRPRGLLCLAIPDRRYTSDYFRRVTVLADVIDAHLRRLRRPSIRHLLDHLVNDVELPPLSAWIGGLHREPLTSTYSLPEAMRRATAATSSGVYPDCRCHVFTPHSFFQLLGGCFELGLLALEVAQVWPTTPGESEFFVILRRVTPDGESATRQLRQLESIPSPAYLMTHDPWTPAGSDGRRIGV